MDETRLLGLFYASPSHMRLLRAVRALEVPKAWIAAGFVRNYVWDCLYRPGEEPSALNDIDVVYFDPSRLDETEEKRLEACLRELEPGRKWSVKNQARMYIPNRDVPYTSIEDALSRWCETVTPVGLRLAGDNTLSLLAPLGLDDLLKGECRPTPHARNRPDKMRDYRQRMTDKRWWDIWPGVRVYGLDMDQG